MKNSKKGITLVELIICCAIIAMIGGACSAVIASGSKVFNQSSRTANAQLDSDVLQTFMMNILPSASNVAVYNDETMVNTAKYLYIDEDNQNRFTVHSNGTESSIRSIEEFAYIIIPAGTADDARAQFLYKATFNDGSTLNGGFIMSNVKFSLIPDAFKLDPEAEELEYINLADSPIAFNVSAE